MVWIIEMCSSAVLRLSLVLQSLNDSESEEVLNAINPNEIYTSAVCESDSGLSEDQSSDGAHEQNPGNAVYQVVYDISGVGGASEQETPHMDVISIELGEQHHGKCSSLRNSAIKHAYFKIS